MADLPIDLSWNSLPEESFEDEDIYNSENINILNNEVQLYLEPIKYSESTITPDTLLLTQNEEQFYGNEFNNVTTNATSITSNFSSILEKTFDDDKLFQPQEALSNFTSKNFSNLYNITNFNDSFNSNITNINSHILEDTVNSAYIEYLSKFNGTSILNIPDEAIATRINKDFAGLLSESPIVTEGPMHAYLDVPVVEEIITPTPKYVEEIFTTVSDKFSTTHQTMLNKLINALKNSSEDQNQLMPEYSIQFTNPNPTPTNILTVPTKFLQNITTNSLDMDNFAENTTLTNNINIKGNNQTDLTILTIQDINSTTEDTIFSNISTSTNSVVSTTLKDFLKSTKDDLIDIGSTLFESAANVTDTIDATTIKEVIEETLLPFRNTTVTITPDSLKRYPTSTTLKNLLSIIEESTTQIATSDDVIKSMSSTSNEYTYSSSPNSLKQFLTSTTDISNNNINITGEVLKNITEDLQDANFNSSVSTVIPTTNVSVSTEAFMKHFETIIPTTPISHSVKETLQNITTVVSDASTVSEASSLPNNIFNSFIESTDAIKMQIKNSVIGELSNTAQSTNSTPLAEAVQHITTAVNNISSDFPSTEIFNKILTSTSKIIAETGPTVEEYTSTTPSTNTFTDMLHNVTEAVNNISTASQLVSSDTFNNNLVVVTEVGNTSTQNYLANTDSTNSIIVSEIVQNLITPLNNTSTFVLTNFSATTEVILEEIGTSFSEDTTYSTDIITDVLQNITTINISTPSQLSSSTVVAEIGNAITGDLQASIERTTSTIVSEAVKNLIATVNNITSVFMNSSASTKKSITETGTTLLSDPLVTSHSTNIITNAIQNVTIAESNTSTATPLSSLDSILKNLSDSTNTIITAVTEDFLDTNSTMVTETVQNLITTVNNNFSNFSTSAEAAARETGTTEFENSLAASTTSQLSSLDSIFTNFSNSTPTLVADIETALIEDTLTSTKSTNSTMVTEAITNILNNFAASTEAFITETGTTVVEDTPATAHNTNSSTVVNISTTSQLSLDSIFKNFSNSTNTVVAEIGTAVTEDSLRSTNSTNSRIVTKAVQNIFNNFTASTEALIAEIVLEDSQAIPHSTNSITDVNTMSTASPLDTIFKNFSNCTNTVVAEIGSAVTEDSLHSTNSTNSTMLTDAVQNILNNFATSTEALISETGPTVLEDYLAIAHGTNSITDVNNISTAFSLERIFKNFSNSTSTVVAEIGTVVTEDSLVSTNNTNPTIVSKALQDMFNNFTASTHEGSLAANHSTSNITDMLQNVTTAINNINIASVTSFSKFLTSTEDIVVADIGSNIIENSLASTESTNSPMLTKTIENITTVVASTSEVSSSEDIVNHLLTSTETLVRDLAEAVQNISAAINNTTSNFVSSPITSTFYNLSDIVTQTRETIIGDSVATMHSTNIVTEIIKNVTTAENNIASASEDIFNGSTFVTESILTTRSIFTNTVQDINNSTSGSFWSNIFNNFSTPIQTTVQEIKSTIIDNSFIEAIENITSFSKFFNNFTAVTETLVTATNNLSTINNFTAFEVSALPDTNNFSIYTNVFENSKLVTASQNSYAGSVQNITEAVTNISFRKPVISSRFGPVEDFLDDTDVSETTESSIIDRMVTETQTGIIDVTRVNNSSKNVTSSIYNDENDIYFISKENDWIFYILLAVIVVIAFITVTSMCCICIKRRNKKKIYNRVSQLTEFSTSTGIV